MLNHFLLGVIASAGESHHVPESQTFQVSVGVWDVFWSGTAKGFSELPVDAPRGGISPERMGTVRVRHLFVVRAYASPIGGGATTRVSVVFEEVPGHAPPSNTLRAQLTNYSGWLTLSNQRTGSPWGFVSNWETDPPGGPLKNMLNQWAQGAEKTVTLEWVV